MPLPVFIEVSNTDLFPFDFDEWSVWARVYNREGEYPTAL